MTDHSNGDGVDTPGTWIFLRGSVEDLPHPWRDRAIAVSLLPLTPDETRDMLQETTLRSRLSPDDAKIASLLASGLSPAAIASRTGKSPRTVHRRLAALRELLNTTSTAELAVLLASRGF